MQVVLVDKLVKTQIVECQAVAKWLFSAEMSSELTKYVNDNLLPLPFVTDLLFLGSVTSDGTVIAFCVPMCH